MFNSGNYTIENGNQCSFVLKGEAFFGAGNGNCAFNRFYIAMSPLFTNQNLLSQLKNDLTSGPNIKNSLDLIKGINEACDNLKVEYDKFQAYWTKVFDDILKSPIYDEVSKFTLPDNQVKTCKYVTPVTGDTNLKNKRIKDLYSNQNLNNDKETFNGKVTFN